MFGVRPAFEVGFGAAHDVDRAPHAVPRASQQRCRAELVMHRASHGLRLAEEGVGRSREDGLRAEEVVDASSLVT